MKKAQRNNHRRSIAEELFHATDILKARHMPSASLDAEALLAYVLKKNRAFLLAHPEYILTSTHQRLYRVAIQRRLRRIPVAYIIGQKEFYGVNFFVNNHTLIPRPDTELLVHEAISFLNQHKEKTSLADIGTGSGCMILSIALHAPHVKKIVATDYSQRALNMAKKNARRLGLSKKVHFFSMNMMETLKGTFDCIVANLPYLSLQEYARAKKEYPEILAEPKHAVCAGKTGFELFNIFFQHAPRHLNPHGVLFLEIGSGQQNGIKKLTKKYFPKNTNVLFIRDLAKRIRVARIEKRAYSF